MRTSELREAAELAKASTTSARFYVLVVRPEGILVRGVKRDGAGARPIQTCDKIISWVECDAECAINLFTKAIVEVDSALRQLEDPR